MTIDRELADLHRALTRAAQAGVEAEDQLHPFLLASSGRIAGQSVWNRWSMRSQTNPPGVEQQSMAWGQAAGSADQKRRAREALAEFAELAAEVAAMPIPSGSDLDPPLVVVSDTIHDWPERVSTKGGKRRAGSRLRALADDVGTLRAVLQRAAIEVLRAQRGR